MLLHAIRKGAFLYGAGPCKENLRKQVSLYQAFVEKKAENRYVPLAVGVLIFDEVKVISRLMWNSRSQQMIGLAMQPEDMTSLLDVYSTYSESGSDAKTDQTSYIMQLLWRDLSSSYDIVGVLYFKWLLQKQEHHSMCYGNHKAFLLVWFQSHCPGV